MDTRIFVNNDLDIVIARMQAREVAKDLGFSTTDQAKIALAASELARILSWNSLLQPREREITISDTCQNTRVGLLVSCEVDVEWVPEFEVSEWASETSQSQRGIAGACHLVDESTVERNGDRKAKVTLIKWLNKKSERIDS